MESNKKPNIIGDIYCRSPLICELEKSKTSKNFLLVNIIKLVIKGILIIRKHFFLLVEIII